ncbi:MAG: 2OG-Fe(II) oxygenase, partial [Bdellovibrionales bacterium]|nr:2OG-Fe(II) oxygenase [Bdellovibrionales bacterium]
ASIGKGIIKTQNLSIRTDKISWVDSFDSEATQIIWKVFEGLRFIAKSELYLPLKRFECHFSLYEPGGFYKKHTDRHKVMPSRLLTCVIYLSELGPRDGGELILYRDNQQPVIINPTPGRITIFDSNLEHEVKPCLLPRRSLTGWLRSDLLPGLKL